MSEKFLITLALFVGKTSQVNSQKPKFTNDEYKGLKKTNQC